MPQLGGINCWLSLGEQTLDEIAVEISEDGDSVSCYVEVPSHIQAPPQVVNVYNAPPNPQQDPNVDLAAYSINWKVSDLTYTLLVKANIDGVLQIEKVHLGRGALSAAGRNFGRIDSVPVTDDWSKRRLLRFVKLRGSKSAQTAHTKLGQISVSFHRAGRATLAGGARSSAKGFHKVTVPDPKTLTTKVSEELLLSKSHATGLGPISFFPPKKVPSVETSDPSPYVTFTFYYRSREILPEEWLIASVPPAHELEREHHITTTQNGGIEGLPVKRPSLAVRAKKWADGVRGASVRLTKHERPRFDTVESHVQRPSRETTSIPAAEDEMTSAREPTTPHTATAETEPHWRNSERERDYDPTSPVSPIHKEEKPRDRERERDRDRDRDREKHSGLRRDRDRERSSRHSRKRSEPDSHGYGHGQEGSTTKPVVIVEGGPSDAGHSKDHSEPRDVIEEEPEEVAPPTPGKEQTTNPLIAEA